MFIEDCKSTITDIGGEDELSFRDEDVRAWTHQVHHLKDDAGVLVLREKEHLLEFALLSRSWELADGTEKYWSCEFHGYGFTGNLRELRHVWFSPKRPGDALAHGYVYYINLALYIEALQLLGTWFDGN